MRLSPEAALLNEPQRRHLGVTLSQIQRLLHEIGDMLNRPATHAGLVTETDDLPASFLRTAPAPLADLEQRIAALGKRFDLPGRERSRYRWIRAVLGNSIDSIEEARAAKLVRYGRVDPALDTALDPALLELQRRLRDLLGILERATP